MIKKKTAWCILLIVALTGLAISSASAAGTIALRELAFNVDGTIYDSIELIDPGFPVYTPTTGSLNGEGLGTLTWSTSAPGAHKFISFFDHDIDISLNTWYNEYGATHGILAAGQSWEIDEPGYVFGNIFTNLTAGTLDNSNGVPSSAPDDVSMALGWDFFLNSGESAKITLNLSRTAPSSGFYLSQTDPDSPETFFYSSALDINAVPAPGTLLLLGSGLAGLLGYARKKLL